MKVIFTALVVVFFLSTANAAISFYFQPALFSTQNLGSTVPLTVTRTVNSPNNNVTLTIITDDPAWSVSPSVFDFSTGAPVFNFTFTALAKENANIGFMLSGSDAGLYQISNTTRVLAPNTLSLTGGYSGVYPKTDPTLLVPINPFLIALSYYTANGVSVIASSDPPGAVVFTPSKFDFTQAGAEQYAFTYLAYSDGGGTVTLIYTFAGNDAALYSPFNSTIHPVKRSLVQSSSYSTLAPVNVAETSQAITLSVNYAPPTEVALVATYDTTALTITPSLLLFGPTVDTVQFTYTPLKIGSFVVSWAWAGTDAALYAPVANKTFNIAARTFSVIKPTQFNLVAGQSSTPYTVTTQFPPETSVTLFINVTAVCTGGGTATANPATLTFSPSTVSQTFTISSNVLCSSVTLTGVLGGDQQNIYQAPAFPDTLSFGKLTVTSLNNIDLSFTGTLYCGETTTYTLSVTTPPPTGFSVQFVCSGLVFTPPKVDFTPTTTTQTITVASNFFPGTYNVQFVVSGTDVGLLNQITTQTIPGSFKTITPPLVFTAPDGTGLVAGTVSKAAPVKISRVPVTSVTITPTADGVTFAPTSVTFTPTSVLTQPLTATSPSAGSYVVHYAITGPDAGCYLLTTASSFSVAVNTFTISLSPALTQPKIDLPSVTYTVSITNLTTSVTLTPKVTDVNLVPVDTYYTFTPATITLTPTLPSATFTYVVSVVRPNTDTITFVPSSNQVSPLVLTFPGTAERTFNLPAHLSSSPTNTPAAVLIVGIPSATYVITLDNPPPTGVNLRPLAPNTVFNPPVLMFTPTATSVSFTITTNDIPADGQVKTITYVVEGTDAAIYQNPGTNSFLALLRSFRITTPTTSVYVGTPLWYTITTPYAPANDLTININGGSAITVAASTLTRSVLDTTTITIAAGTTSASFSATPTIQGNNLPIKFVLSGTDASSYSNIPNIIVSTVESPFTVTVATPPASPVKLSYDVPSYLLNIRLSVPPPNGVTIQIYSQQVTIQPTTFTFTSTATSADFYVLPIYQALVGGATSTVALQYVVSGPDADNYAAPSETTFSAVLADPLRTLSLSTGSLVLFANSPTTFTVTSPIPPLTSVVITPSTPADNEYTFTPASVTLTPTASAASFSVARSSTTLPLSTIVTVVFVVSGPDAFLYANPGTLTLFPTTGTITTTGLSDTTGLVVNRPLTISVVLSLPPASDLTVTPAVVLGQQLTFSPTAITFSAGQLVAPLTITGPTVGTARIDFTVTGTSAPSFSFRDDIDVVINPGTVSIDYIWNFVVGGQTSTANIALTPPTANGLTVTLAANGVTFNPPTVQFAAGASVATFTATPSASGLTGGSVVTTLGGADALIYNNPYPSGIGFSSGSQTATSTATGNAGLIQTITFTLSTQPQAVPVTFTPSGVGLTFVPTSVSITDPSQTTATVLAIASAPSSVNVFFSLSGAGGAYFTAPTTPTRVGFTTYALTVTTPTSLNVAVGGTSDFIRVSAPTSITQLPTPIAPITVTPQASIPGITFTPSTLTINSTQPFADFTASSATAPGSYTISYLISGPGAAAFGTLLPTTISTTRTSFVVPTTYDYALTSPPNSAFIYGVSTQLYTIALPAVPANVQLLLSSDSFEFFPSILSFTPQATTATFRFVPVKIGPAFIRYTVLGNATLYNTPGVTTTNKVTYNVHVPQIPVLTPGLWSAPIPITIQPPPQSSFTLAVDQLGGSDMIFQPPTLVFTPTSTTQSFNIFPFHPSIGRKTGYGGPVDSSAGLTYDTIAVLLTGTDALDGVAARVPLLHDIGIIIAPAYFILLHPRYQLDVKTTVTVAVSAPPRSDVILSLIGNNINFEPPYVVFTVDGPTIQEITATPRHTTSYELDYEAFRVDYYVTGTNSGDYVAPAETLHYFAIPQGYIAAIILVPLAFIVLVVVGLCVVQRGGAKTT